MQRLPGGVEVAVVRGSDANRVDWLTEHIADRVDAAAIGEDPDARARGLPIFLAANAGAAGDRGQFNPDDAEIGSEKWFAVQLLE